MKCQIFLFCSFFALIAVGNAQDDKEDKDPIDAVPSTAPSSFPSIKPSVDGNNSTETSDVPTDSPVDSEEVTLSPTASEDPDPPPTVSQVCVGQPCDRDDSNACSCRPGLQCRQRSLGEYICSQKSRGERTRLSGLEGIGGAAGRDRIGERNP
mmetsp:Transcript_17773/g.36558  ORF Transcript_17773/g.36558 Transcript_17773/m.36558 type:complete len:153 (+) Transcript_17773:274-732(+)